MIILHYIGSLVVALATERVLVQRDAQGDAPMITLSSRVAQVDRREFVATIPPATLSRRALLLRVLECDECLEKTLAPPRRPPMRLGPSSAWRAAMLARQCQSAYLSDRLDPRGLLAARGPAAAPYWMFWR